MAEQKSMEEAIDKFVESLEQEQKSNKLIESNQNEKIGQNLRQEEEIKNNFEIENNFKADVINDEKEKDENISRVKEFIAKIISSVSNSEVSEIKYDSKNNKIDIYGKDLGIAIGKNGRNMEAIEYIVNLYAKRKNIIEKTLIIDIKNYKKKKGEIIKDLALRMAKKAIKEGRKIILKPMPSYERKIIHDTLSENKDVKTKSKNKEPYRRIIIYPNKEN
ncbi:MAG: KH domain-containing protein [Actinobacteria bacterium]|nr:KH domain-containing protein [Actinomycetota bacterium]